MNPPRPGRRVASTTAVAVGVVLVMVLAACQPGSSLPSSTSGAAPASQPGATTTPEPPTSFGPAPSPTADEAGPVILDPSLLGILPESVDGFPITEAPDEAALALSDPALPAIASALDAGVAVDTGGGNLVYALVVQLRQDVFNEESHRQWRDSYDEGACTAAGGVAGNAEAEIAGRQVFIGSCAEGLRTYHVWLQGPGILVSSSSIGEGRFGEKLMGSLRVPA